MKFRIITNGSKFRVERRGFFGMWHTEGFSHGYGTFEPHEFATHAEAEQHILERVTVEGPRKEDQWEPVQS